MIDNQKIYYSFHDLADEFSHIQSHQMQNDVFRFRKEELKQILMAISVLTIAFSFSFVPRPPLAHLSEVLLNIPISFIAILTAFFGHEIAHKYMGLKFGFHSEFQIYPLGLIMGLLLGVFTGFVFAAPGAVRIFGHPNRDQTGKISMAGPLVNIIFSISFLIFFLTSTGTIAVIFFQIAFINSFLALFNLIPFGFLDGAKIISWRIDIWAMLFILTISVLIFLTNM